MSKLPSPLAERLAQRIAENGPLTIADYMASCLGDDMHGYYRTRDPLGARGDFITAPEVSQIFGELIGLWCITVWRAMGMPGGFRLVELGPGRGTLMADALRAASIVPDFAKAASVELVETSPVLREAQRTLLLPHGPRWHDSFEEVPPGPAIIIANEFLDALPIHQYVRDNGAWRERCITLEGDGLTYCLSEAQVSDAELPEGLREGPGDGDIVETRPAVAEIVRALSQRAAASPTAALFIDYGHAESAPGDTFQALAAHGFADPLAAPGEQDLTAHVDFEALAQSAGKAGLLTYGPMEQGAFLLRLGLAQRLEKLLQNAEGETRDMVESGAHRLADPAQMGSLFKVLAVTSDGLPPPAPFQA